MSQPLPAEMDLGQPIIVQWDDAYESAGPYWRCLDDVYQVGHVQTIGFYLRSDDRFLTLAQTLTRSTEGEEDQYGGVFNIPLPFIDSIRIIKGKHIHVIT